jgi:hypothetical protein
VKVVDDITQLGVVFIWLSGLGFGFAAGLILSRWACRHITNRIEP